ncbi:MAG TPA: hypothetical protein VM580_29560, partial [Labilithrix sp.]|nr:hypothetical protein [Labilithrix sp.]
LLLSSAGTSTSCAEAPDGSVNLVTGEESDVFSRAPAPVLLVTEKIELDGKRVEIARTPLPATTVDLGEQKRAEVGAIAVSGLDETGQTVVRGETLFIQWGALEKQPLEVFVQRTGELARMPRGPDAFDPVVATTIAGRYVFAANGTSTLLYDLLSLRTLTTTPTLPRPALSIASVGTAVLLVDTEGATTFDLSTNETITLEPPAGGTFAEVAGGDRVVAPDGTQFIVGATRREGGPTARVLVLDPSGKVTFAALTAPREGACATYVEGRGLVVLGGDAHASGAEVLAPGVTLGTPLPFPTDATRGCGAAALDSSHVALAGGADGPVRVLDLACTTDCTPAAWPDTLPLVSAEALRITADSAFVVGNDASGATHAYRASASGTRELPLRTPRRGARLLAVPTGAFVIVGGAPGIEQYLE